MINSLSNDRKVILKSGITGLILIIFSTSLLLTKDTALQTLAALAVIATYWFIPTWLSRNRQLEKREVKGFTPEGIEIKKFSIPEHQYFNADGEKVINWSSKERFTCLIVSMVITLILLFFPPFQLLTDYFPDSELAFSFISTCLFLIAPYIVRHSFYFYKNLPIDTSFTIVFTNSANISNRSRSDVGASNLSSQLSSPEYSYLTGNIYNHRNY